MKYIKGFIAGLGMFSIIPMPYLEWDEKTTSGILPTFPLVGLVLGGIWWGVAMLFSFLRLPITLTTPMLASFIPLMTGFIHLDGLMDTADAMLSRRNLDRRKEILKDPHVGSFGVIAVIIYFMMLIGAIATILSENKNLLILIACSVVARAVSAIATMSLSPMHESGYAVTFRQNVKAAELLIPIISIIVVGISMYYIGYLEAILGGVACGFLASCICFKSFRGFSGDLAGTVNAVTELACLLFACV